MNRLMGFAVFFTLFLAIYAGMHYYVYRRLLLVFGQKGGTAGILAVVFLVLLFPAAGFLERSIGVATVRALYIASAALAGLIFLLFWAMLLHQGVVALFAVDARLSGAVAVGFALILGLFGILGASSVTVKDIEVPLPGLERTLHAVLVSDLHAGTVRDQAFITKVVSEINRLSPDMVFITGDLIDGAAYGRKHIYTEMAKIRAKTFFVTGNHEGFLGRDEIIESLQDIGVTVLDNRNHTYKGLNIIGLPDDETLAKELSEFKILPGRPTVLLRHQPVGTALASAAGVSLQLSGHTHAGQIMPFNLFVGAAYRYTRGLYRVGEMYLYVSPGTGTWGPPMRVGSRNEITHFTLLGAK